MTQTAKSRKNPALDAAQYRLAQAVLHGTVATKTSMTKKAAQELIDKTPAQLRSKFMKSNAGKGSWRKTKKAARKRLGVIVKHAKRKRHNPEGSATAAYVLTHGKQPGESIEVKTSLQYHSVLAGMGKLQAIIFAGGRVKEIRFGKGTYLAMNEKANPALYRGGRPIGKPQGLRNHPRARNRNPWRGQGSGLFHREAAAHRKGWRQGSLWPQVQFASANAGL